MWSAAEGSRPATEPSPCVGKGHRKATSTASFFRCRSCRSGKRFAFADLQVDVKAQDGFPENFCIGKSDDLMADGAYGAKVGKLTGLAGGYAHLLTTGFRVMRLQSSSFWIFPWGMFRIVRSTLPVAKSCFPTKAFSGRSTRKYASK